MVAILSCALASCGRIAFEPGAATDAVAGDPEGDTGVPAGLVAYFELEGTYVDSVAGNTGSCVTTCPVSTPGHIGTALLFDGAENCITVPDAPSLRPTALTVAVWARLDNPVRVAHVSKVFGTTTDNSYQLENTSSALMSARLTTMHANTDSTMTTNDVLVVGQWQHLAGSWDGQTKRVYVDGVERASASVVGDIVYDAGALLIGCDNNNATFFAHMDGAIDDVQLYNRALEASEIASLAQR